MVTFFNYFKLIFLILFFILFTNFHSISSEIEKTKISIKANETLEWFQNEKKLIAKGDVELIIDQKEITANKITVFYEGEINESNITKLIAEGNAKFKEKDSLVVSNLIDYNVKSETIFLLGNDINVFFPNIEIKSNKKLDYFIKKNYIETFGESSIKFEKTNLLTSKNIKVKLTPSNEIDFLKTFSNSFYTSLENDLSVSGENMYYNKDESLLEIEENVIIDHQNNKLKGDVAKVNIAKGISTVLSKNSSFVSGEFINNN